MLLIFNNYCLMYFSPCNAFNTFLHVCLSIWIGQIFVCVFVFFLEIYVLVVTYVLSNIILNCWYLRLRKSPHFWNVKNIFSYVQKLVWRLFISTPSSFAHVHTPLDPTLSQLKLYPLIGNLWNGTSGHFFSQFLHPGMVQ